MAKAAQEEFRQKPPSAAPEAGATNIMNAYPELERDLRFFPLGVERPNKLRAEQIAHYNSHGFIAPIRLWSTDEVTQIRLYFDELLAKAQDAGWDSYEITNWHKTCPQIWDLVNTPKLLDYVQDLLGETIICRHSHFFAKLPGDGKRVAWHQVRFSEHRNCAQVVPPLKLTPFRRRMRATGR